MAIRGKTRNVALQSISAGDVDEAETFVPIHIDRRNGRTTLVRNWRKRDGYELKYDLGVKERVHAIIDFGPGYAITDKGKVLRLGNSPLQLTGTISVQSRPQWLVMDNTLLIAAGGLLMKIAGTKVVAVGGSPPNAKYLALVNTQVVAAGYDRVEWAFSAAGSFDLWDGADRREVESTDESVTGVRVRNRRVYFWKTRTGEIWDNVGGEVTFTRSFYFHKGTPAPDSLVDANETYYWWGYDGDFYQLKGAQPTVISQPMRRELDTLEVTDDCYGFDFRAEHCICWFFPTHGRCFVFDYLNNQWSEDNVWRNGGWHRLPVGSYGEVGGERLIGDYEPTGKIYERKAELNCDDEDAIRVFRRFVVRLSADGNKALLNRAQFRVLRGQGSYAEVDPEFFVRWRFDRGPWSDLRNFSLGQKGDHDPYIDIYSLGVGREVMFEVGETDAARWLITDLNLTVRDLGR